MKHLILILSVISLLALPVLVMASNEENAVEQAVNSSVRDSKEVRRDENRKPAAVLNLLGIKAGMSVVDLASGSGYYTDILSKAVGQKGSVIAHNIPFVIDRFTDTFKIGGPWDQRFSSDSWKGTVSKLIIPLDELKLDKPVDAAVMVLFYHDTIWQKTDREKMNVAIFNAIKAGGHLLIIDHSAELGSAGRDAQSFHRVDKELVINELTTAGFKLVKDSNLLSHPEDSRDYNVFRDVKTKRDQTDRFVLKFLRP